MPGGIIRPNNVDKAWIAADPAAALMGYVSTILAVFGVFDAIGLDADQVAILGGAVLGVFATLRTLRERRQRTAVVQLAEEHVKLEAELQKMTGSLSDGEVPADEAPEAPETPQDGPGA